MKITEIKEFLENSEHDWKVSSIENSLLIETDEGIQAVMTASNSQILVESLLFPVSALNDADQFNREILEVHKTLPLTTVGISTVQDEKYYCAFGALSADSILSNIELEVASLFVNVGELLQFATQFINSNEG